MGNTRWESVALAGFKFTIHGSTHMHVLRGNLRRHFLFQANAVLQETKRRELEYVQSQLEIQRSLAIILVAQDALDALE